MNLDDVYVNVEVSITNETNCNALLDGRKEKGVSQAGVQFYHELIDELLKNGYIHIKYLVHKNTSNIVSLFNISFYFTS